MQYNKYSRYIDELCSKSSYNKAFTYIDDDNRTHSLSYLDLHLKITSFKLMINKLGIKPGNRVCLLSNNLFYSQIAFLAASYCNICVALIDPKLPEVQIKEMLSTIDFNMFLMDKQTYDRLKSIISCKTLDITDDYASLNNLDIRKASINEPDEMAIIFSSGTTDLMKPIVLSYDSIINSAISTSVIVEGNNQRNLCLLPMYHISGMINLLCALYKSCCVLTVENLNLNNITDLFKTLNPNSFVMTPLVVEKMINSLEIQIKNKSVFVFNIYKKLCNISLALKKQNGTSLSILLKPFYKEIFGNDLKLLVCSSSQLTNFVIERINSYGITLINSYASTECGNPITHTYGQNVFDNTVGKIDSNPNISIKLINIDENGVGEICVKTNSLMKCYYNDPKTTKESFDDEDYFITGDLGEIINDFLYIRGRSKETIKLRNGKKLSPIDLENNLKPITLNDNPIYISGYSKNKDEYDDVYAFLVDKGYTKEEKKTIKSNIIKYNNEVVKSYPIKDVIFVDSIPYNSIGKVKRYELVKNITKHDDDSKYPSNLIEIISKYVHIDENINENISLNSLGIDSLSMYSIIVDIKEKYNKDITSYLSSSTTIKDLIEIVNDDANYRINIRKIKPNEIEEMAKIAADCFYDYPLYKVFYPDDKQRKLQLFYNCWFIMYKRQNYTYITNDKSFCIAFMKPDDKSHSVLGLLLNPKFLFKFLMNIFTGIKAFMLLHSYSKFSTNIKNKYYNPSEDNYVENMFVRKDKQGSGIIFNVLSSLNDGKNIYAETHTKENVELYEKMGAQVLEAPSWHNVTHYVLLKKNDVLKK